MFALLSRRPRLASALTIGVLLAAGGILQFLDVNPAASQTAQLFAPEAREDPGIDPNAAAWASARSINVQMSGQLGVYSTGGGSITSATISALHYKEQVYIRVEWSDATQDDVTTKVEDFSDAAAVEFPALSATTVPSICMGQADSGVNIWHWRADSQQAQFDPDQVYPNALVDSYPPRDDDLWYPARAVGNPYADHTHGPVQTLIAQAFGSLSPANAQNVAGEGVYSGGKWAVVFSRPFAAADPSQAQFSAGTATDMAVAIWNGSQGDRNGRKSTSGFVTLRLISGPAGGGSDNDGLLLAAGAITFLAVAAIGGALATVGYLEGRRTK